MRRGRSRSPVERGELWHDINAAQVFKKRLSVFNIKDARYLYYRIAICCTIITKGLAPPGRHVLRSDVIHNRLEICHPTMTTILDHDSLVFSHIKSHLREICVSYLNQSNSGLLRDYGTNG